VDRGAVQEHAEAPVAVSVILCTPKSCARLARFAVGPIGLPMMNTTAITAAKGSGSRRHEAGDHQHFAPTVQF